MGLIINTTGITEVINITRPKAQTLSSVHCPAVSQGQKHGNCKTLQGQRNAHKHIQKNRHRDYCPSVWYEKNYHEQCHFGRLIKISMCF